jgi:hopanoid biosynthesis associated protein HpnK
VRRLIVNADDFGLTPGVNRAIVEAHQRGVVTSTTLMANASAFDDAVKLAKQHPTLDVGCHVVLMDGEPVLPARQVPTLIAGGAFRDDFTPFAAAALRGRLHADEIERETAAQIRKIQDAGLTVSHIDAHKHAHMFPRVLRPMLRAAAACGVPGVRNPFAPVKPLAFAHLMRRPRLWTRYSEVKALRCLGQNFRRDVEGAGLISTDGSFGVVATGALDAPLFEAIVGCIPEGTWEFVCHPGYHDADLQHVRTRLQRSRALELAVLTSPAARWTVESRGIDLISYRALAREVTKSESAPTAANPKIL